MSLTALELLRLKEQCEKLGDGKDYRCNNYISNLMQTVLDFRMRTKYAQTYWQYFFRNHKNITVVSDLQTILDKYPNDKDGNLALAEDLWNTKHGARAKFLRKLIECFEERGITDQESLEKWVKTANFETHVKGQFKTKEFSIGYVLFEWLQIRCGVDTVKPDVHVLNFIRDAIGRSVEPEEAVKGLKKIAKILNRKAYLLDAAIWEARP